MSEFQNYTRSEFHLFSHNQQAGNTAWALKKPIPEYTRKQICARLHLLLTQISPFLLRGQVIYLEKQQYRKVLVIFYIYIFPPLRGGGGTARGQRSAQYGLATYN